jgi:hypothetical protein
MIVVVVVVALAGCTDDGPEGAEEGSTTSSGTSSSSSASTGSTTTERDYTVTTGPYCTAGTVPDDAVPPPGCDRIYSPFVAPGHGCTEGQDPDCIDPDRDGQFRLVIDGGRCLVERKDHDRCRDDDDDGTLDEPLTG